MIKCLGKWFNESLMITDKDSIEDTKKRFYLGQKVVDGSGLPGKYKACIYPAKLDIYSILLRITLLLLMYEVVEAMEKKASGYLSR